MQIAICDDEQVFRKELRKKLVEYKTMKRISIDIYEFDSGEALLATDRVFDMVFMDYQMPGIDGYSTAKALRARNPVCNIIFVTSYPEKCIIDAFKIQTFRFLIKPISHEDFYETMESYIKQLNLLYPIIIIEDGEQKTINAQDIVYLEADNKNCTIRTKDRTYHSSKTLGKVLNRLPQYCFFRTHKSYAINLYCVDTLEENRIHLTNDEIALVSRSRIAKYKRVYADFLNNFFVKV